MFPDRARASLGRASAWLFTIDGSSGRITIYCNGEVMETRTVPGYNPVAIGFDRTKFFVGRSWWKAVHHHPNDNFHGHIQSVKIWNEAISWDDTGWARIIGAAAAAEHLPGLGAPMPREINFEDCLEGNYARIWCPVYGHPEFDKGAYHEPLGCCCIKKDRTQHDDVGGQSCDGFFGLIIVLPLYIVTCAYQPCGIICAHQFPWFGDCPCSEQRVTPHFVRKHPGLVTRGPARR